MSTVSPANQAPGLTTGKIAVASSAVSSIAAAKPPEPGNIGKAVTTEAKLPDSTLSDAELTSQLQALQAKMDRRNPALDFVLDQSSGRALIQLTDRKTKEVIQQFPAEAAIQFSKELDRLEKGHLVHKTV